MSLNACNVTDNGQKYTDENHDIDIICVLVCFKFHCFHVKCLCRSRAQVGGEPNFNQKIPERYFVITNDELLHLKYILVFAQQTVKPRYLI